MFIFWLVFFIKKKYIKSCNRNHIESCMLVFLPFHFQLILSFDFQLFNLNVVNVKMLFVFFYKLIFLYDKTFPRKLFFFYFIHHFLSPNFLQSKFFFSFHLSSFFLLCFQHPDDINIKNPQIHYFPHHEKGLSSAYCSVFSSLHSLTKLTLMVHFVQNKVAIIFYLKIFFISSLLFS